MNGFINILIMSGAVMAICWAQGPALFERCPDGKIGTKVCNGRFPDCPPGQQCYAPTDMGVCCRRSPPQTQPPLFTEGTCPLPPGCDTYLGGRRCWSNRNCRRRHLCCPDGCGRKLCMEPLF